MYTFFYTLSQPKLTTSSSGFGKIKVLLVAKIHSIEMDFLTFCKLQRQSRKRPYC